MASYGAHPRVSGENQYKTNVALTDSGSSPRERGKRQKQPVL